MNFQPAAEIIHRPHQGIKGRWVRWALACTALLIAAGALLLWLNRPAVVTAVRPHRGPAVELVYATGYVEPVQPVAVAARLTAPVIAVLVQEGETVRKGQALLRLDDADLRTAYAQAHALSIGAALAERRARTLFAQGWVTQADRDAAVAAGDAARAAERTAAAKLGQAIVRAGIDGVVIKHDIEPGELAVPTRSLMLLGNPRRSWITTTIDERDVPRVHLGQRAYVSSDAWPGRVFTARVAELTPTGDPQERAFRARLLPDDRAVLPLGMSLEVNIVTREVPDALLVPNSALVGDSVWTIVDGRARRQRISLGIRGQDGVQVQGLDADALLIASPAGSMKDGMRVTARKQ